jgi:hypothetical protein
MFCESRARNRMRTHRHLPLTVGQRFPRQTWLMPGLEIVKQLMVHTDVGGCGLCCIESGCFIAPWRQVSMPALDRLGTLHQTRGGPSISECPFHVEVRHAQPVLSCELTSDVRRDEFGSYALALLSECAGRDMTLAAILNPRPQMPCILHSNRWSPTLTPSLIEPLGIEPLPHSQEN